MTDQSFSTALAAATTAEDFICAVADLLLADESHDRLLVDFARQRDEIIAKARTFQRPIDSDIGKMAHVLAAIRDMRGGDHAAMMRQARSAAAAAIRQHNRSA